MYVIDGPIYSQCRRTKLRKFGHKSLMLSKKDTATRRRKEHGVLMRENTASSATAIILDIKYMCEQILAEKKLLEDHWIAIVIARANSANPLNPTGRDAADLMAKAIHAISGECGPRCLSNSYLGQKSDEDRTDLDIDSDAN